ncbi:hypothetical protein LguiA_014894 [Lonicera macranthoides]
MIILGLDLASTFSLLRFCSARPLPEGSLVWLQHTETLEIAWLQHTETLEIASSLVILKRSSNSTRWI